MRAGYIQPPGRRMLRLRAHHWVGGSDISSQEEPVTAQRGKVGSPPFRTTDKSDRTASRSRRNCNGQVHLKVSLITPWCHAAQQVH